MCCDFLAIYVLSDTYPTTAPALSFLHPLVDSSYVWMGKLLVITDLSANFMLCEAKCASDMQGNLLSILKKILFKYLENL